MLKSIQMLRQESLYFCCFNGITVNLIEERDRGNMSNGLNLVYARCYSSRALPPFVKIMQSFI